MPEPVMDREKKACPIAMTQVSTLASASHFGTNRKRYPSWEPGRKNTLTARMANRIKNRGIKILFALSIWFAAPVIRMITVIVPKPYRRAHTGQNKAK